MNSLGGLLFRNVPPGSGYRVRPAAGGEASSPLTVLSKNPAPSSTSIYNQSLPTDGYGYMTTRDGTKLAVNVHPPQDVADVLPLPDGVELPPLPAGPTPTLIEYSGYGYADPAGPQSGIAVLANLMGFTVVDVNMRGTGCSGGAFDFFEPLQSLDGYDVVETVARQPWALHGKVGMMGISYGGISQLFTASTNPPSLAAIAPFSVIDNTQTTLYPGGILNTGFAVAWAQERIHDAQAASPTGGQPWAYKRVQEGDQTCKANQALHPEAVDLMAKIRANDSYVPEVADPLSPVTFVNKIKVPTFMACQWTDEQTGGHCPTLSKRFTGTDRKWFTFTNGTHVDSLAPETFNRWYDFLQLYVARRAPIANSALIRAAAPVIYQEAMGITGVTLPPDPIQLQPTYATALAAFEQLPSIRVLFDNGAGGLQPGHPVPAFERSWPSFPIPGTTGRSWYLGAGGSLADAPPAAAGADSFTWNARNRPLTNFTGNTAAGEGGLWTATPPYQWSQNPAGSAASYVTAPLGGEQHRGRRRGREGLGTLVGPERGPPGDDQRGQARRQGDVRAGRLAAGRHAQARRRQEHPARARAEPQEGRRVAAAGRQVRRGDDPALLPGARLPGRVAHPGHRRGAQRRPADLVVRRDGAQWHGHRVHRPLEGHALEAAVAGRADDRPDRAAAVPGAPGRAVPRLPAVRQSLARAPAPASSSGTTREGTSPTFEVSPPASRIR